MLGNVRQGHYVIIARAHSSFSRVSAVAIAMIASICAAARSLGEMSPLLCPGHLSSCKLPSGRRRVKLQ